jgi:Xaa-Pro aminopeptidase
MIAVVETEEFLADVKGILSEDEHDDLILYVALYPEAGDLIPQTGGLRKLRWTAKGKGKRGGSSSGLLLSQHRGSLVSDGDFREECPNRFVDAAALTRQLRALKSDWKEKKLK